MILLAACGKSTTGQEPAPVASRPDLTVTFDGKRRKCIVALAGEAQGSSISCDELVPFVKDELRLPSGSIYDIQANSDADEGEIARIRANMNGAGYRPGSGSR
ncbi:MAG: hypothetical protein ABSC32_11075 [Steroidobacteraceae bacterium]